MAEMTQGVWLAKVNELLGRLARDPVWGAECAPLADAGAALAVARATAAAKGGGSGKGGGRPGAWLRVSDGETEWFTRGAPAAAKEINDHYGYDVVNPHALGVYLSRGAGTWGKRVTYDDRELPLHVRKAKPREIARLEPAQTE